MVQFRFALSLILLAGTASISSAFTVGPRHGPSLAVVRVRSSSTLYMGWGPDPVWTTSTVESTKAGNPSEASAALTVAVSPETAAEFTVGGQYVQVRPDEETKPLFLAIASPPEKENARFEFLVKKTDDNGWLTDGSAKALEVSQVLGGGFPVTEGLEGCESVLLFAAGSGIAPIRSAIESGALPTSGTARLYYGARSEEDLCFVERFPAWEKSGVEVVPVLSQPSDSWEGRKGYVQQALEEDGIDDPKSTGALLCGMKGMAEDVTEVLTGAGTPKDRILTNF